MSCAGCGGDRDDWNPDCRTCMFRHRARAVRSGDPAVLSRYHAAAHTRHYESAIRTIEAIAARRRSGEIPPQPRGQGGRFVTV